MSALKKPKIERDELMATDDGNEIQLLYSISREDQEEALVGLIQHRTKEVERLLAQMSSYQAQLDEAKKSLEDSQTKLARLRSQSKGTSSSKNISRNFLRSIKVERRNSPTSIEISEDSASPPHNSQLKPILVIPAPSFKKKNSVKASEPDPKASSSSGSLSSASTTTHVKGIQKVKTEKPIVITSEEETIQLKAQMPKRKFEQKEDFGLSRLISSQSSPQTVNCQPSAVVSSQHKRKLRSLVLSPTDDKLFVTSALDGVVNLWQVEGKGSSANLLNSSDCTSIKQRRWPEDIAWHPQRNSLFSVYVADGGESQISVLDLNKKKERKPARFLEDKPHVKGVINSIVFTPWEDTCFVTGGSDHAVVVWTEKTENNSWKSNVLHRSIHSSAVMGVAAVHHKQTIMSAGADRRVVGFDLQAEKEDYKYRIESKCMSIIPNPRDFNLFVVHTGTRERQLQLLDLRIRGTEIHSFGWKQESSETQSALVSQAWSPDGLYITSGSADPLIHIFDIRYSGNKPSQSVVAHQKRVFKAAWHNTLPLLISISSDLNIGLHKIS